ncbi:hypothetical protein JCM3770_001788 [Rhodotorula araucariae]
MYHPTRGGTRGGQGDFKWTDVAADKDREFYLGHSLKAPVGRWQNGKDLTWYNKDKGDAAEQERLRLDELKKIKEAEEDALAEALGFAPTPRPPPSASTSTAAPDADPNAAVIEKARRKAEKHAEKEARRAEREKRRQERASRRGAGHDRSHSHDHDHERERDRGERRYRDERDRSRSPARRREGEPRRDSREPHDSRRGTDRQERWRGEGDERYAGRDDERRREQIGSFSSLHRAAPASTAMRTAHSPLLVLVLAIALAPSLVHAFFEQFFHHSQQEPQGPAGWDAQLDAVSCATYVCPDTLTCVSAPADCPCPSALDTKCSLGGGEGAYVCSRDCARVRTAERVLA